MVARTPQRIPTEGPESGAAAAPSQGGRRGSHGITVSRCDVWWTRPWAPEALLPMLSFAERRRMVTIVDPLERALRSTGWALLRVVLADRLHLDSDQVPLGRSCRTCGGRDHGKPYLVGTPSALRFSVAHAGSWVGVAMTSARCVGLDLEPVHDDADPSRLALAGTALSARERHRYDDVDPAERARFMSQWWTRKQAVLKATGDGMAISPAAVVVTPPDRPPAFVAWEAGAAPALRSRPPTAADLLDVSPAEGYVGCVAVLGPTPVLFDEHDGDRVLRRGARATPRA